MTRRLIGVFACTAAIVLSQSRYVGCKAAEQAVSSSAVQCVYAATPMSIDGRFRELAWQKANPLEFHAQAGGPCISKTEARLLWDENYLYVGFRAYDKDVWSYMTKHDDETCEEDVLEVFIKTDPDKEQYYDFEINALGTVMDMFSLKKGAGGEDFHRWAKWNCKGLKVATYIKGTLNNPDDVDEYWQLEVAIPFSELSTLHGQSPKAGDRWKCFLARYDYSVYLPKGEELSTFSTLPAWVFNDANNWCPMDFVK